MPALEDIDGDDSSLKDGEDIDFEDEEVSLGREQAQAMECPTPGFVSRLKGQVLIVHGANFVEHSEKIPCADKASRSNASR